jgi:hypothetical protein
VQFTFHKMKQEDAQQVACWHYAAPYDFYDWDQDQEDLHEWWRVRIPADGSTNITSWKHTKCNRIPLPTLQVFGSLPRCWSRHFLVSPAHDTVIQL